MCFGHNLLSVIKSNASNVKLFERLGKKIILTEAGAMLFEIVSTFIHDIENLKKCYTDMQSGLYGTLTLAVSRNVMTYWFTKIIKSFTLEFPNIKFKLYTQSNASIIQEMILNGKIDFGIGSRDRLVSNKLDFITWKSFDRILMADKNHPISKIKTITLADIAQYPLILTRFGTTKKAVDEAFVQNNIPYEIVMEMDTLEFIKYFLKDGTGLSIFSSIALTEADEKQMTVVNVRHLFGKIDYGIYFLKDKYISRVMNHFIHFIAPEIADRITLRK
jgi:DNA-binding transcriptional LysR family regulator